MKFKIGDIKNLFRKVEKENMKTLFFILLSYSTFTLATEIVNYGEGNAHHAQADCKRSKGVFEVNDQVAGCANGSSNAKCYRCRIEGAPSGTGLINNTSRFSPQGVQGHCAFKCKGTEWIVDRVEKTGASIGNQSMQNQYRALVEQSCLDFIERCKKGQDMRQFLQDLVNNDKVFMVNVQTR
jgi:hypothetical protein